MSTACLLFYLISDFSFKLIACSPLFVERRRVHFLPLLIREERETGNVARFIDSFPRPIRRNYGAQEASVQSFLLVLCAQEKGFQYFESTTLLCPRQLPFLKFKPGGTHGRHLFPLSQHHRVWCYPH